MPFLKIPPSISTSVEAHAKWLEIVKQAQRLVEEDRDLQEKAAKFLRLKERALPPEVLGRNYAQYCDLINKMYDAYLNSVHMQRSPYMLEIISVFMKRLYELRNELVHLITNDYVYVDAALSQIMKTPYDIQIVVPYHIPLESRPDSLECMLQTMWLEAVKRKNAPPVVVKPTVIKLGSEDDLFDESFHEEPSSVEITPEESVHTIIPEEFIQAIIIQKQERYRKYFMADYRSKCRRRRMYFAEKIVEPPMNFKIKAATLIVMTYRIFMKMKRERVKQNKRDILLGIIPDPFKERLDYDEENKKMYDRRRRARKQIEAAYQREMERENTRLIVYKRDTQIEDITVHVREWFREWFYGYGFFPEYPYDIEGGTMMVITEAYPTIEEKMEQDEKLMASTKGKTKEQLKHEKEQAEADEALRAEAEREAKKKEAENLFKMRCNPFSDPGYQVQQSKVMDELINAIQKYRAAWSIYDRYPADTCADVIYGYMQPMLTEDLMCQLHKDCRIYVDELMRLDLKLLIKMHQVMYKNVGWKYPKLIPRKKPKVPPPPKLFNIDSDIFKSLEPVFDLSIISKPTSKLKDVFGDMNYAAYDLNIQDPAAKFPPPGYGDIRRRVMLSCILGSGVAAGATRNKAVLLVGPPRNGKSFLVDCVAGEMNAIKIDISPRFFSAVVPRPAKILKLVFLAAKVYQPAVIFLRDIEKVFTKKVLPQDRYLKAKKIKKPLLKCLKQMSVNDKIIFIATSSFPKTAKIKPMVSIFNEMILVPRADYGTLQQFLYNQLQSIRSMPRDYCVQSLAQILQGYGTGLVAELFHEILSPERIVRLNETPLSPKEFLELLIERELEPLTMEDYKEYMDFYLQYSPVKKERAELEVINVYREVMYRKMAKRNESENKE